MDIGQIFTRFSFVETLGLALRVQILLLLDLIANGALIVLAVNLFDLTIEADKRTTYDVLYALERHNVTDVWDELTWTSCSALCVLYFFGLLVCAVAFFIDTRILLAWTGYTSPFVLAILSLMFSLEYSAAPAHQSHDEDDGPAMDYNITSYWYRLLLRGAYAYGASAYYIAWRRPLFAESGNEPNHDGTADNSSLKTTLLFWLLPGPFFVPLFKMFFGASILSDRIVWALFTPLLVNEIHILFRFTVDFIFPYYLVGRLMISRVIARPDILQIQNLVILHWHRLRVPLILQIFFFARLSMHLIYVFYVALFLGPENDPYGVFAKRRITIDWLWTGGLISPEEVPDSNSVNEYSCSSMVISGLEYLLTRSCETAPAILASASIAVVCGRWAGCFFRHMLNGERRNDEHEDLDEDHESVGLVTGVLFMVLCLQTGISSLPAEKRLWKLYRNLWLLGMAILHFVHHMVESTMTRLCTHGRFRWTKHARAIILGIIILFAPCVFFKFSWRYSHWLNPWLISVALFAVSLAAKMVVSFATYALLLLDVFYRRLHVDESLYFVKTTGAVLEFIFGFCLLINGVWILFYEHGGILRTITICIHGYLNIYQRAKKGIAQLRRRRLANQKLNTLQTASRSQLQAAGDEVCSICYVELNNANEIEPSERDNTVARNDIKVTACGHYLHAICLMKWLYIRDTCPLCHQTVFEDSSRNTSANDAAQEAEDEWN